MYIRPILKQADLPDIDVKLTSVGKKDKVIWKTKIGTLRHFVQEVKDA